MSIPPRFHLIEILLLAQAAAVNLCLQTMVQIIPSLQNITQTDTFTSPALQSVRGAETAYRIYVGETLYQAKGLPA